MNLTDKELKLKEKYGDEEVLVIKSDLVPPELDKPLTPINIIEGRDLLQEMLIDSEFVMRYTAEQNPSYRQIIPHIMCVVENNIYATRRLNKSGEARLVGNIALGVGGHINPCDNGNGNNMQTFVNATLRELQEELNVPIGTLIDTECLGFINDTSNDVGKDHIGVLVGINFIVPDEEQLSIKEVDKLEGILINIDDMDQYYDQFENWGKIVYNNILKPVIETMKEGK